MFIRRLAPFLFSKIDARLKREINRSIGDLTLRAVIELNQESLKASPGLFKKISKDLTNLGLQIEDKYKAPSNYLTIQGTSAQIVSALKKPEILKAWAAHTLEPKATPRSRFKLTPA